MSFYYSILQTVFGNIKNFHTLCFSASANYPLCLCFFFYAWKFKQENTVIFVRLNKNSLIQTKSNQIAKQQIQEELILIGEKILKFNLMLKQTKGPTVDVTSAHFAFTALVRLTDGPCDSCYRNQTFFINLSLLLWCVCDCCM